MQRLVILAFLCVAGVGSVRVRCGAGDGMAEELLSRVVRANDTEQVVQVKRVVLLHLIKSSAFVDLIECDDDAPSIAPKAVFLQEDEDGDDGDDGGGGGGGAGGAGGAAGGVLNNANVLTGVRRILANVFTGNLIGVIQESVGLRSPEGVTNVFTDVLSTLFGSNAVAGVTGVLGNLTTTTVGPPKANGTGNTVVYQQFYGQYPNTVDAQYLAQLQALQIQQQQQKPAGSSIGSLPGLNGVQHLSSAHQQQIKDFINLEATSGANRPGLLGLLGSGNGGAGTGGANAGGTGAGGRRRRPGAAGQGVKQQASSVKNSETVQEDEYDDD